MHTTEEARKTWCPEARVSRDGGGNRYPQLDDAAHAHAFARCIADECSQWCWVTDTVPNPDGAASNERPYVTRETRGFCGRNVAMAMKVFGP